MNREENLCWFHGKISRHRAEEILRQEEPSNGVFLVRESNTSEGDYVLSVLHEGEIFHCQIRRHGDDAFFSIDDQAPIHGLDTLIEFYRESPHGTVPQLMAICKSEPPPNDVRSHGTTNLLHRATKENNYTVVSELLKCGYRNIDSKNQNGQTAVHLASINAGENILAKLIERGSNINNRDAEGNTALHYACRRHNSLKMVRMLIEANANLQARNNSTGWVPLHEAAASGNLEAVKELLSCRVPHMPRSLSGELPADFAKENGHLNVVEFLKNYVPLLPTTHKGQWFHGTLDRKTAVESLKEYSSKLKAVNTEENKDNNANETDESDFNSGVYLVRYSDKNGGYNVLTLLFRDQPMNFIIQRWNHFLYIDEGPYMLSLEHLVEHYRQFPDGLPVNLKYPVPPQPKPPIPLFSTIPKNKNKMRKSSEVIRSPERSSDSASMRKFSEGSMSKSPPTPQRNLSVPNESMIQQMNKVGLFDRSIDSDQSLSPISSPIKVDDPKNNKDNNFRSLKLKSPKKKNIIIDGMKSLRLGKKKQPIEEISAAKRDSFSHITNSNLLTSLSFSSDFSALMQDQLYNVPTNNCAIVDIDIGEPTSPSSSAQLPQFPSDSNANIDYFTQSDLEIAAKLQVSQNPEEEETYFVDPPVVPTTQTDSPTLPKLRQNTPTNYIRTKNVPVFMDLSPTSMNGNENIFNNNLPIFNRLESTMSTVSQDSTSSDNEYFRIIKEQQEEDEKKHLRYNKNSTSKPNYFIPAQYLVMEQVLGKGEFGSVYKGILKSSQLFDITDNSNENGDLAVAIKTLLDEHCKENRVEFLREASVMIKLRHHCIVKLIGISKDPTLMMIEELVTWGSMLEYIVTNASRINPKNELNIWASQIASGMEYLQSQHFVHRDLAARNILLASKYQAKISDFGLSRALGADSNYYQASQGGKWPIKWYAPESFNFGTFSHASDVWSFGVTLWEMFSLGKPPYAEMKGVDVIKLIENNQRLPQPDLCPDDYYTVMMSCWDYNAHNRPSFTFLSDFFAKNIEYQNIQELVQEHRNLS